jgi:hypothetical protein
MRVKVIGTGPGRRRRPAAGRRRASGSRPPSASLRRRNWSGVRPMASEVGAGTFWQAIVDHVTGPPPADPCSTRSRPLADSHADPF